MSTTRLIACLVSIMGAAGLSSSADPPTALNYKFEPGQEITYRSSSSFKYGEKENAGEHGSQIDWTVQVIHPNKDGSFRLLIKEQNTFFQVVGGQKHEQPIRNQLAYADVFLDGRILPNDTIKYQGHPGPIFPQLPRDQAEAAKAWSWERDGDKITAKTVKADTGFRFETVTDSPMNAIYLSSSTSTFTFDPNRGLISGVEAASTQGYGFKGKGTGTTELVSVKMIEPALMKQLAAEETKYFGMIAAYDKAMQKAGESGAKEAEKQLEEAVAALKSAKTSFTYPAFKTALEDRVKQHEETSKYTIEGAARREKVVGKQAEAFDTKDIDGKSVKLTELKGKVVVLDFWYRGCGWCIKAMPQMNGLAEDFAGKPVAIFGMNTDRNEEDARFVIEKMGLKYPTLKATGLPEKFGVQGFPTLIVIDQEGKVHDMHVGYTSTLREDVGRQIKSLLEKR
jgi:thiol-disulfide isomerase/thioredoxin